MLLGREAECARLDDLLAGARKGRSGALVLRGAPGIGKSALLDYAVDRAADMAVLRARGVESEAELPFSALSELLRPVLGGLETIPAPQAAALAGAIALGPPVAGDRFSVYSGTLSLLAAAAEGSPLLAVVDDAHWLDGPSQEALLFAARRLEAEGVVLLFAAREEERASFGADGVAELALLGLDREASMALLAQSSGGAIAEAVAERLFSATAGNPLALVELPLLLSEAQRTAVEALEDPLPVGPMVERAFRRRLDVLPAETRRALVVAAASESGAMDEILDALAIVGLTPATVEVAEAAGLVELANGTLAFRHPLLRAVAYHGADAGERRAAHNALAVALARGGVVQRRAWHLAAAALAPEEEVAAALEEAALMARAQSGAAAAASAFERAARLTADAERRARRLLEASRDWAVAGRFERALELSREALALARDPLLRADVQHQRGHVQTSCGPVMDAHELLLAEASRVETLDPTRAAIMAMEAVGPCFMAGHCGTALATASRAQALAEAAGMPELPAGLPVAQALVLCGEGQTALPLLLRAEAWLGDADPWTQSHVAYVGIGHAFVWLEEYERGRRFLSRAIERAREASAPALLPYALAALSELNFRTGDWTAAYADASEAVRLAAETGQKSDWAVGLVALARVEAGLGRAEDCRAHLAGASELMRVLGAGAMRTYVGSVLGFLELGHGRSEDAIAPLEDVAGFVEERALRDPSVVQWAPDLIEAYVRVGRADDAQRALATFEGQARYTSRTWALAAAARCRGLLAGADEFEREFEEALSWHDRTATPFERARTQLSLGERLRRAGRRVEARASLHAALDVFDSLGAAPWAERARAELGGTGERLRRRKGVAAERLTPQELQVALAVAEGATNREAAAALFLSPKTIEFHLRSVYRKLGIRSRTELARLLSTRLVHAA